MSTAIGVFAIGLMVIVLTIAVFSLLVAASIPIGRMIQRRREATGDRDLS